MVFCAVFRYSASDRPAFERAYGPDGDWAAFFRGGIGYMGTELLASDDDYLLIDRWTSEAAYEAFLAEHREEYERRSAEAEAAVRARGAGRRVLVVPGVAVAGAPGPGGALRGLPAGARRAGAR